MAAIKVSGGLLAMASSVADNYIMVYEVPNTVSGCTGTIHIANVNNEEVEVYLAVSGLAPTVLTPKDFLLYRMPLEPNGSIGIVCSAISPGEKIYLRSDSVGVGLQLRGFLQQSDAGTAGGLLGRVDGVLNTWMPVYEAPVGIAGANTYLHLVNTNDEVAYMDVAMTSTPTASITPASYLQSHLPIPAYGMAGISCGAMSPGEKIYVKAKSVGMGAQVRGYTRSST